MSAISGATVGVALGIDLGIGIASLLLFSVLRICRPTNRYYDPRTYYGASSTRRAAGDSAAAAQLGHAPELADTPEAPPSNSGSSSSSGSLHAAAAAAAAVSSSIPSLLFPSPSPLAPPGESGMPLPGAPLPPVLPKTLLTWVVPLLRLPEQRVIAAVGLDVAMLLRFIRFALKLLLVLMVWCIGVVLPVNYSGTNLHNLTQQQLAANAAAAPPAAAAAVAAAPPGFFGSLFPTIPNINSSLLPEYSGRRPAANNNNVNNSSSTGGAPKVQLGPGQDLGSLAQQIEQGRVGASDLDVLSMANIPAGSPLLWVHLASVYVVSAITLKLLWSATSDALRLYLAHLSSSSMNLDSASHTALLTDIPGMPRGTLIDKVLHTALFGLLPSAVKRRLRATWTQFFAAAARGRSRPAGRAQPGQKRTHKSSSSSSSSSAAGSSDEEGEQLGNGCVALDGAAEQLQTPSSSTAVQPGAVAINIAAEAAAAAAESAGDSAASGVDQSAAATAASVPRIGAAGLNHRKHRAAAAAASRNQQQQQWQQQSVVVAPVGGSALDVALRGQQAQGLSAGVGGVGVFSDEWRRAARALQGGASLEEFVLREFQEVYGPQNVVAVQIVSYSPRIAKLVMQYNTTRLALEDLLDHYSKQLHEAVAAAGRRRKRGRAAALLAAPFAALARCCGKQQQQQQQHLGQQHAPLQAIKVRTLVLPKQSKKQRAAAAASTTLDDGSSASSHDSVAAAAAAAAGVGADGDVASSSSDNLQEVAGKQQQQQGEQLMQQHGRDSQQQQDDDSRAAAAALPHVAAASQQQPPHLHSKLGHSSNGIASKPTSSAGGAVSAGAATAAAAGDQAGSNKHSSKTGSSSSSSGKAQRKGDACEVLLGRLQRLQQQLAAAQREAAQDPLPAAFVTFRTRTALTAAVSSHHVAEAGVWKLTAAPPPDSLNWGKLGLRYWEVGLRRGAVYSVLALLGLFYVVPVAVVQGLLQLERLQALPVIGKLVSLPGVRSLLLGVLPGLALRIFVLLLPVILYALNRRAGPVGAAQLDGWVATHFFALQVIIVFFASFITGSLFNQINVLFTQGLAPVLDRLGTGAPQTANFFILYIIFTAFIGRSWALLRPWGLLMSSIRALAARNRGRSGRRRALLVGTYRMFGPSVPEHSMMLLLALVLSVIAPLVLAAAFVFFCMAIVVESYNWVWVFRRPYEGGGRLWKQLFRHVFIALYIFQLIMAALLIVKRFVWVVLLLPLFFLTALTQHIGSKLLQRSWDVLSVRAAHELDLQDRQEAAQALRFWQQPQLAGQLAGNAGGGLAGKEGDGLAGKQPQARVGSSGAAATPAGVDVDAFLDGDAEGTAAAAAAAEAREAEEVCRSQAAQWAQLYRPPAEQLLEAAGPLQETLAARVGAMQARLAAHNAAAAAEAGLKRQAQQALGRV